MEAAATRAHTSNEASSSRTRMTTEADRVIAAFRENASFGEKRSALQAQRDAIAKRLRDLNIEHKAAKAKAEGKPEVKGKTRAKPVREPVQEEEPDEAEKADDKSSFMLIALIT